MTFSQEDKRQQLRARCSDNLKAKIEQFADEHDKSQSEVVREAVEIHLPGDNDRGPADSDLRDVWQWLRERSDDDDRINAKEAVSELSQTLSMKEKFVKSSRLQPLERKDWIRPNFSYIEVIDRD